MGYHRVLRRALTAGSSDRPPHCTHVNAEAFTGHPPCSGRDSVRLRRPEIISPGRQELISLREPVPPGQDHQSPALPSRANPEVLRCWLRCLDFRSQFSPRSPKQPPMILIATARFTTGAVTSVHNRSQRRSSHWTAEIIGELPRSVTNTRPSVQSALQLSQTGSSRRSRQTRWHGSPALGPITSCINPVGLLDSLIPARLTPRRLRPASCPVEPVPAG
jgi:hypothetical protein